MHEVEQFVDRDFKTQTDDYDLSYYLRQVNEVNGGDNVFIQCVFVFLCVCLCVRSGPVNQSSLKRS